LWGGLELGLLYQPIFLYQPKSSPPTSVVYQSLNLFGALGVGINVFVEGAYPSVAIQVVWALIAIFGLYKSLTSRKS